MWFKRRASLAPRTPLAPAPVHPVVIHEFFRFRNTLVGRGIVEHAVGDRPRIVIRLPSGEWREPDAYPDAIHADTETRTCFNFTLVLPRPLTGPELAGCSLYLLFRDDHLVFEHPGAARLASDRFLTSEGAFWTEVHQRAADGATVLEIGSRARSGIARRDLFPASARYIGLDVHEGPNVDVVGDAHRLSHHFPRDHFDFAFSVSVWEHLAMPWKVSVELNRVLKPGGLVMINTHQTWPSHEEPWDYFRFSEYAWRSLFNAGTGFEIVDCGQGCPCVMAAALPQPHLQDQNIEWHYGYLASRVVARKVGESTLSWDVPTELVATGLYPH